MGKGNPNLIIIVLLIFALQLIGFVGNASGGWSIDILDPDPNVAQDVSLAIDSYDKVHIVYSSKLEGEGVKYVTNASGSWERTIIDPIIPSFWGGRGNTSIAIDSNNKVHISYCSLEGLKYVTNASGSWESPIIPPTTCWVPTSIAIDSNNKVYISFDVDYFPYYSKYATNESGNWEIIDLPIGDVRSIALDFSNNLHIISGEWYATNKSGSWQLMDLYPCVMTSNDSIAIDHNDIAHLICTDHQLYYFTSDGFVEVVESLGCAFPSIATDSNNNVHISSGYSPPDFGGSETIRYITNVSGGWVTTIVENDVITKDSSIAVDSNGNVHIAYSVSGVGLKYATKSYSVCQYPSVRNARTFAYYSTLQVAYDDPETLDGDTIQSQAVTLIENPNFYLTKSVTIRGGYDCDYNEPPIGKTILNGNMTISDGAVTIENFILE